jgi:hypothetical protein
MGRRAGAAGLIRLIFSRAAQQKDWIRPALAKAVTSLTAILVSAAMLAAAPAVATQLLPGGMPEAAQMRAGRNMSTPPVVTNRSNNVVRQGLPLPMIVAGLQAMHPYRGMRYIGIERFDQRTGIYSLRFLNGRQILVVQVDGRTGRIINRGY